MVLNPSSSSYRYRDFNNGSIILSDADGKVLSDSKADADSVKKIVYGSNAGGVLAKSDVWTTVATTLSDTAAQLTNALSLIQQNWQGGSATESINHLTKLRDTATALSESGSNMGAGLRILGQTILTAQSSGEITDDNAAAVWAALKNGTNDGLARLPTQVAGDVPASRPNVQDRGSGPGGPGPGYGGVPTPGAHTPSFPGRGGPGPGLPGPGLPGPGLPGPGLPGLGHAGPGLPGPGGPGGPGPGYTGGLPGIDTGSTLAGLGGGGLGGLDGGGAGVGGGVGGGLGGSGSALTGSGSGLAGSGGNLGVAGGPNIGGVGSAAPGMGGGRGMMPMMGGGQGGGDQDRERTTWLAEDDDLWAGDDAPPPVIR